MYATAKNNNEQKQRNVSHGQKALFPECADTAHIQLPQIDKHAMAKILSEYRSTGPINYTTSLVLARILKEKERN